MEERIAFGKALQRLRKARGLTQEDFAIVSSRTYLSTLERGLKSPTLDKIHELAQVMNIHPLTLLALAHAPRGDIASAERQLNVARDELQRVLASDAAVRMRR